MNVKHPCFINFGKKHHTYHILMGACVPKPFFEEVSLDLIFCLQNYQHFHPDAQTKILETAVKGITSRRVASVASLTPLDEKKENAV